jgi:K(+)-stimulated pyrophosphate-energized sodium pump
MSSDLALALSVGAGIIALIYGAVSIKWIVSQSAGNERMQEIAGAIQEGASAYLNKQYTLSASSAWYLRQPSGQPSVPRPL